ncbi:MAG: hypothetical protein R3C68_02685 [Myxococcota bacterium]
MSRDDIPASAYEDAMSDLRDVTSREPNSSQLNRVLDRVYVNLDAGERQQPRRNLVLGFAALSFASLIAFVVLTTKTEMIPTPSALRITSLNGDVQLAGSGQAHEPDVAAPIAVGSILTLASGAKVVLEQGADRYRLSGPAQFQTNNQEQPVMLSGTGSFVIEPRRGGDNFILTAGDAQIRVIGTEFTVWVKHGLLEQLEVQSGVVEVSRPEVPTQRLIAGQFLTETARAHDSQGNDSYSPRADPRFSPQAQKAETGADAPIIQGTTPFSKRHQEISRAGAAKNPQRSGHPPDKSHLSSTASEETALFEAGIDAQSRGAHRQALHLFDRYLSTYPGGDYANAIAFRRCEVMSEMGQGEATRKCLKKYASQFPKDPRADDALFLLAGVHRKEGAWLLAANLYTEIFKQARAPEVRQDALFYRILCLRKGNLPGLAKSIGDYMHLFPEGPRLEEVRKWQP